MYHCLLQFYLTGPSSALWDTARSMPALDGFQHAFTESREPQAEPASRADVILGPIGVILAGGILGEVSASMAAAVSGSEAVKILIPSASCGVYVAGVEECRLEEYLQRAAELAERELGL